MGGNRAVGDPRNKIAKIMGAEGDKRRMAALQASVLSSSPKGSPTIHCSGCGLDGRNQSRPNGTFVRFIVVPGDQWWHTGKIFCEFCLTRRTGEKLP